MRVNRSPWPDLADPDTDRTPGARRGLTRRGFLGVSAGDNAVLSGLFFDPIS
jgi:hypothetical protein